MNAFKRWFAMPFDHKIIEKFNPNMSIVGFSIFNQIAVSVKCGLHKPLDFV